MNWELASYGNVTHGLAQWGEMVHDQLLIVPAQDEVDADPISEDDSMTERKTTFPWVRFWSMVCRLNIETYLDDMYFWIAVLTASLMCW